VRTTKIVQKATVDNPALEKANETVKTPAAATVTATSVASLATVGATGASGAGVLTYLQFLFTQPLLLLTKKRRKGWGIVYDAASKKPVDLAVVRVYNAETKKLVRTKVTDKAGRYEFILKPGKYYIEVQKKDYKFPCKILDKVTTDGHFEDVYYGEVIEVQERDAVSMPIALDPIKLAQKGEKVMKLFWFKKTQTLFTLIAPVAAIVSFIINPTLKFGLLIVGQVALYFLFSRLAKGDKPKSWGIVRDLENKKTLSRTIVRVFETKFNKLLDTQVTDGKGRYAFLVGNQEYYVTAEKPGYYQKRSEVFNLEKEETGYLTEDFKLRSHKLGKGIEQAQKKDQQVTLRTGLGQQKEKMIQGIKRVIRRDEEKFKGEIKDVDLDQMHEDYYDVDSLK
ncbi:carboxypeptidase regulatory-like domain-containing protein, partial [Candidatus Falkowbacteria bacterium]|nr:carboxypeptidase regulatory-like domain-containing protein [Candidatus Falkowbacteria bacterium]